MIKEAPYPRRLHCTAIPSRSNTSLIDHIQTSTISTSRSLLSLPPSPTFALLRSLVFSLQTDQNVDSHVVTRFIRSREIILPRILLLYPAERVTKRNLYQSRSETVPRDTVALTTYSADSTDLSLGLPNLSGNPNLSRVFRAAPPLPL